MPILTYGINHQSAPIEIREKVAFNASQTQQALQDLIQQPAVNEAVLLSTCNRTELYAISDDESVIKEWFAKNHVSAKVDLNTYFYSYSETDAVRHALRVACGLDSMVLGEPQIFGQMKEAYRLACEAGTIGKQLQHLFPAIFAASKQIRYKTDISKNPISIAYAVVLLAKQIFSHLEKCHVLLVGTGEMIELIATHLESAGITQMTFASRTLEKANAIANSFKAKAIRIGDIPDDLPSMDIVITATASQLPIIGKGLIERTLKHKKRKPLLMADLAVPRDIESEVGDLEDVYLYNLDHLQTIIEENLKNRAEAAKQAEIMADIQAKHYSRQLRVHRSADIIRGYRDRLESLRDIELSKAISQLKNGQDSKTVLEFMAHNLINKIMHQPTLKLREAAYSEQADFLWVIKEFFNL